MTEPFLGEGVPNVRVQHCWGPEGIPYPTRFFGTCLVCDAIVGKYGGGFSGFYSTVGRAIGAMKMHFAATHDEPVVPDLKAVS